LWKSEVGKQAFQHSHFRGNNKQSNSDISFSCLFLHMSYIWLWKEGVRPLSLPHTLVSLNFVTSAFPQLVWGYVPGNSAAGKLVMSIPQSLNLLHFSNIPVQKSHGIWCIR
jgi:hypothetical protein